MRESVGGEMKVREPKGGGSSHPAGRWHGSRWQRHPGPRAASRLHQHTWAGEPGGDQRPSRSPAEAWLPGPLLMTLRPFPRRSGMVAPPGLSRALRWARIPAPPLTDSVTQNSLLTTLKLSLPSCTMGQREASA